MKNKLVLFTLFFCIATSGFCSQCSKVSWRFMDRVNNYPFVGMVEVIGKDTITSKYDSYTTTKVKVLQQYKGQFIGNEINIIDAKGFEYFVSLNYQNIGDKFIIKASPLSSNSYEYNKTNKKLNIIKLGLCDTNTLWIKNNTVNGDITINKMRVKYFWSGLLKKITFGLIDLKSKLYGQPRKYQTITLDKFQDILEQHLES